jgi:hypothetical protein
MNERFISFDDMAGIVAVILFAWSAVLLWATWQLQRLAKDLDAERQAVRRWKRLHALARAQNVQWQ